MTPDAHSIENWVGPKAGLNAMDEGKVSLPLPGIEPRLSGP
jgi:hypothetical protein